MSVKEGCIPRLHNDHVQLSLSLDSSLPVRDAAIPLLHTLNERIIALTANSRRRCLVLRGVMAQMESRDATLAQPTQQHFGFDKCHAPRSLMTFVRPEPQRV